MGNRWHRLAPKQGPWGAAGRLCLLLLAAALCDAAAPAATVPRNWPKDAQSVPIAVQDAVEAAVSARLVRPQSAKWMFDYMVPSGSQFLVCGKVDFQSAMQKYVGAERFYAYVRDGEVTLYQLKDPEFLDTTGAEKRDFDRLCGAG